jgi:hypothetical protein
MCVEAAYQWLKMGTRAVERRRFNLYSLGADGQYSNDTAYVWDDGCHLSLGCPGLGQARR